MTEKDLKHLHKSDLIEIIYQMQNASDAAEPEKESVAALSSTQLETAHKRYRYGRMFHDTLRRVVAVLIVVAALSVLTATLWMPVLQIHGSSMSPTLKNGQIVLSLKTSRYKPGDLVCFYYGNKLLVKRIIAGPGDWISIEKNGDVYVNGTLLDEPYLTKKALGESNQSFPLQLGDERWFLMGDNRAVSADSRMTTIGTVSSEQIVGKIILRIWPWKKIGLPNGFTKGVSA